VTFDLYSFRLDFSARGRIQFPEGSAGNVLRGALGAILKNIHCVSQCPGQRRRHVRECERNSWCPYAQIFEPASLGSGPSGLGDWPRPFVLRAAHLNGKTIAPHESFCFDINLFETRSPNIEVFAEAFAHWATLLSVKPVGADGRPAAGAISIPLEPASLLQHRLRVQFRTPTELKGGLGKKPEFGVLFARAQDRVGTLRQLYGAGPLAIDFQAMRAHAASVRMTRCELQHVATERRSSRTGQVHEIGGFVGMAEYEGALGEFLPYLEAARWTGVGRQCVWGKGELGLEVVS
jgi:hypothetical protein